MCATHKRPRTAFTLIELLVVVAIIALLISILLPSLHRARQQAHSAVCLSNLRSMGQAVIVYSAETKDQLPGPLHPAVYRDVANLDEYTRNRFLLFFLRRQLNDSSGEAGDNLSTCPVAEYVNPDENFERVENPVHPTHYVINTTGEVDEGGPVGGMRVTNPPHYFGWSHWSEHETSDLPQKMAKVNRPAEEWMIADAWYRMRSGATSRRELQQEGPYQSDWSGAAFPNFAPHFSGRVYDWVSDAHRDAEAARIREGKDDGITNTVFFDGHAEPVESKTYMVGEWDLLYGFPGTVNPAMISPAEGNPAWDGVWK